MAGDLLGRSRGEFGRASFLYGDDLASGAEDSAGLFARIRFALICPLAKNDLLRTYQKKLRALSGVVGVAFAKQIVRFST